MKIFIWKDLKPDEQKLALSRPAHKDEAALLTTVTDILRQVRDRGDSAVREFGERFDHVTLKNFRVSSEDIAAAEAQTDAGLKKAMQQAVANILKFHEAQRPAPVKVETMPGIVCELHWRAIETAGFYIPGGTAPLFSSLLMQAIPAWVAGCRRRILCTPPQASGKVDPAVLAAANLCGLTEIYAVGGAQAIAAMAYGTETIPKVDKISGPGNAFVTKAKQMVAQDPLGAAIDLPAGPSEVMILLESSPRPDWIAGDLLAQAEHDVDAQAILVTTDPELPERVLEQIQQQLAQLPRKEIAEQSLRKEGRIIVAPDMKTALDIVNAYAPEHLILHNMDSSKWLPDVKHAGSVFVGPWTPEAAGDYASGANHVLPTYGYARAHGGVSVFTYMKSMTVQNITKPGIKQLGPTIVTLAEGEGLRAHANSILMRMKER